MTGKKTVKAQGYLTVYLALTMAVMLSLYLALIEGVRMNAIKMEAEIVADIGLNSVLAEYHRELYRQYNLFAIDTSYGTPFAGKENVEGHLQEYLERNMSYDDILFSSFFYRDFLGISLEELELTRVSIMTDDSGAVFRKRAIEAIKDDVGLNLMAEMADWMRTVEEYQLTERDIAAEKQKVDEELEAYDGMEILVSEEEWDRVKVQNPDGSWRMEEILVSEEEWGEIDIENPTEELENIRKKGSLQAVVDNPRSLSHKSVDLDSLVGARMEAENISRGNWKQDVLSGAEQLTERFLFQEYLVNYMGRYGCGEEDNALQYQLEYIVNGKDSDIENLHATVMTLCAVREVANTVYLFADKEKCAAAEVVATVLAAAMLLPEITDLLKVVLILGWAYAESLYDVELLLKGGRVPLLKDDAGWHYDVGFLMDMGNYLTPAVSETGVGLSYVDYLRIFMGLTDLDTLTVRAMDMVEADIRKTPCNSAFRLDACYDCIEANMKLKSMYGYGYELTRSKRY